MWDSLFDDPPPPRKRRPALAWTQHHHEDMLEAKRVLSLEEHGMLQVLHDMYCRRLGVLPDDPHFIAGHAGIDVRKWRRLRGKLLEQGFIEIVEEKLVCSLKRDAVADAMRRMENGAKGGRASGVARRSKGKPSGWDVPGLG